MVNLIPTSTSNAVVTINAPSGYTVNNGSSVTINTGDYSGVISVGLYIYILTSLYSKQISLL